MPCLLIICQSYIILMDVCVPVVFPERLARIMFIY